MVKPLTNKEVEKKAFTIGCNHFIKTIKQLKKILRKHSISFNFVGGYCLWKYNVFQKLNDVDILVYDKDSVKDLLINQYQYGVNENFIQHPKTKVNIDLLQVNVNNVINALSYQRIYKSKEIVNIEDLISVKLSYYYHTNRHKDLMDVTRLVIIQKLPYDLKVSKEIEPLYKKVWKDVNYIMY